VPQHAKNTGPHAAAPRDASVIYDILFTASAETMVTIAADPKHLGARIGITSVLHTWGSALTHQVHMIVPAGGISLDGTRWVPCRPDFILPVEVLSCLFRGLFLAKLVEPTGPDVSSSSASTPGSTTSEATLRRVQECEARLDAARAEKATIAKPDFAGLAEDQGPEPRPTPNTRPACRQLCT
jgi:hypothetical protein